jgi:Alkylmercury lyase
MSISFSPDEVRTAETEVASVLRRDERGDIVGVAGLSVVASRHQLWIVGRQFWTWCACDALGILAALKSDGRVISQSPETGAELTWALKQAIETNEMSLDEASATT